MKQWVSDLSTTNFRIFISIILAVICVLFVLGAIIAKRELQVEALYVLFGFVGVMLGLDVTQYLGKRKTEFVNPPTTTAENATTTTVATAAAPSLTRADAMQAAQVLAGANSVSSAFGGSSQ